MQSQRATAVYDDKFFDSNVPGSLRSARAVVPIVLGIIPARSVVDFGCGRGTWLKAFREGGVSEILGLDGAYLDRTKLLVDEEEFQGVELAHPIALERKFDLAICLEVAEHLPLRSSRTLVSSLTAAAPLVMFSAAIPGQGGTSHVNEQWPEFWEDRFSEKGFRKFDVIRPLVLRNPDIEPWYRQNLYLFADVAALGRSSVAVLESRSTFEPDFNIIDSHVMSRYKTFSGLLHMTRIAALRSIGIHCDRIRARG